jgi:hypothetical protein
VGKRRAGVPDAIVVATNLASGTPLALDRILERRTDKVALVAPVAVLAALAATVRGGWAPVAATAVLHVLNGLERKRHAKDLDSQPVSSVPGPGSSDG